MAVNDDLITAIELGLDVARLRAAAAGRRRSPPVAALLDRIRGGMSHLGLGAGLPGGLAADPGPGLEERLCAGFRAQQRDRLARAVEFGARLPPPSVQHAGLPSDRQQRQEYLRSGRELGIPEALLRKLIDRPQGEDLGSHLKAWRQALESAGADRLLPRPELEWRVRLDPADRRLEHRLSAANPALQLGGQRFLSVPWRGTSAGYFHDVQRDVDQIFGSAPRQAARAGAEEWGGATQKLAGIGASLAQQILPDDLRATLRAVHGKLESLWILSEEPWIPWELLVLDGASGKRPLFLGEAFDVCRWPIGSAVDVEPALRFPLRRVALVQPEDAGLTFLAAERAAIAALFGDRLREVGATFSDVRQGLALGNFDGWHFSGHGVARGERPDGWGLLLERGEELTPHDLRAFASGLGTRPLVVMNACYSARQGESLTGIGGLAQQFLEAGAGAVLGAQFVVSDEQAAVFSAGFYRRFLAGSPVGEAMRQTRLELRAAFPADPGWLAWSAFAHPLARWEPATD